MKEIKPQWRLDGVEYCIHKNTAYYRHHTGQWRVSAKLPETIRANGELIWPGEERINRIGQNGNTGEHYK